ncbi:MAG: hypothetical protein JSW55_08525, partial [Chloroflexota bacterium]
MLLSTGRFTFLALLLLILVACRDQSPEELDTPGVAAPGSTVAPAGEITVAPTSMVLMPLAVAGEVATPEVTVIGEQPAVSPTSPPVTSTATPASPPTETAVPAWLIYDGPPLKRANMGLQIHLHREDLAGIMAN